MFAQATHHVRRVFPREHQNPHIVVPAIKTAVPRNGCRALFTPSFASIRVHSRLHSPIIRVYSRPFAVTFPDHSRRSASIRGYIPRPFASIRVRSRLHSPTIRVDSRPFAVTFPDHLRLFASIRGYTVPNHSRPFAVTFPDHSRRFASIRGYPSPAAKASRPPHPPLRECHRPERR
jgi:hypothetical protein